MFLLWKLKLAEDHGLEPKEISKIYFSLAETLVDNQEFSTALEYYKKELDLWSNSAIEVSWIRLGDWLSNNV